MNPLPDNKDVHSVPLSFSADLIYSGMSNLHEVCTQYENGKADSNFLIESAGMLLDDIKSLLPRCSVNDPLYFKNNPKAANNLKAATMAICLTLNRLKFYEASFNYQQIAATFGIKDLDEELLTNIITGMPKESCAMKSLNLALSLHKKAQVRLSEMSTFDKGFLNAEKQVAKYLLIASEYWLSVYNEVEYLRLAAIKSEYDHAFTEATLILIERAVFAERLMLKYGIDHLVPHADPSIVIKALELLISKGTGDIADDDDNDLLEI